MNRCPKCHYIRKVSDSMAVEGICPACGIAYKKWLEKQQVNDRITTGFSNESLETKSSYSFHQKLFSHLTQVPESVDAAVFYARVALLTGFIIWGLFFLVGGTSWESVGSSFLHSVNLPFHEFGHVLFSVFGRFMGILGGSLFQILVPIIFTFAFCWQPKDNFAGAITLWWCGQNFIDISPYIADAPYRAIPLIGGLGEEAHDWGNLLTMLNALDSATTIAWCSFFIGFVIMLIAYFWAGNILLLQKQRLHKQFF